MQSQSDKHTERDRRQPLLLSIQLEIEERTSQIATLEERRDSLRATPKIHEEDIRHVEAELSNHRRELRGVEKELARLGIAFDAEHPHSIIEASGAPTTSMSSLGETGFRQYTVDSTP